ncbi:MAG: class I tRNA ligase family protein, partial [Candidatus Diapherotrites archaeon]|nr:class I tRNA ligase family protein [Candidatus Diapherotrites archaeon]
IDPIDLAEKYSTDSLRYFLLREIPFGSDGDFSEEALIERHNNELANSLGNLLNRTLNLTEKKLNGKIPGNIKNELPDYAAKLWTIDALDGKYFIEKIDSYMEKLEINNALNEIFSFIALCNKYIDDKEPWKLSEKEAAPVLYSVLDSLRVTSILLAPFIPGTAEEISKQLNVPLGSWKELEFGLLKEGKIGKKKILFEKLEAPKEEKVKAREISVKIDKEMKDLDFKLVAAVIEGVKVKKKHEGLDKKARETIKATDLNAVEKSDVIKGYLELYDAIGVKRDRHAVKNLVEIAKNSSKLPTINTVVDSYNLVSIKEGLIVGAHDLENVSGNVRIKRTNGKELYVPLGAEEKIDIPKGEYAFVDDKVVL